MNKEINYNYKLPPFKWFCLTNFPFIEADFDALTYYELLCKVVQYLNEVIVKTNAIGEQTEELTNAFNELKNYVDTYFDNLDVQEEINNKLDDMVEQGTLQEIISQYLNSTAIFGFDNVASMKSATNLIDGSYAKTMGYYSKNDGGSATYKIRTKVIGDTTNNMTLIQMENQDLVAELIFNHKEIEAKKIGVHCDMETDDLLTLQNAIDLCKNENLILVLNGYAYVSNTIDTKGIKIKGIGKIVNPSIVYNSSRFGNIGYDYLKNVNNGALITFEDYKTDNLKHGSGIISDTASPIIKCNSKDGHFNLNNLTICGWLRNTNQKGILSTYDSDVSYIYGNHKFENISVINCGGNGIEIQNLESTVFKNNIIKLNGNYGLFIKGDDEIDTPTEYSYIIDNTIEGNFNNGIYIKDSFRKLLTVQNNNFSRNGLYIQLGLTPPVDNTIISGLVIENRPSTASTQTNFVFNSNYGEEVQTLLKINIGNTGSNIFNSISIIDNIIYPVNNSSYLAILNGIYYSNGFEIGHNSSNGGNIIDNNIERIGYLQTTIQDIPVTYIQSLNRDGSTCKKQGQHVHIEFYGNFSEQVNQYQSLVSGLPKSITNNRIRCFAFLINPTTGAYQSTIACSLTPQGILQNEQQISNGSRISFYLDYMCYDNVL